ncbi:sensor histidine kinase [Hespellia stercorisuis]|uniref:histidine kinase n=1 Tax=Hespellia stercorisuis DSM 15480 TaxID=1121950 RepID=A0A1M6MKP6_9FIRM|nr:sensor histidine kinase [Hespellia stercorisuis]SHJ83950.1 Signal transduction histidine kinase [Hespellia stercorisuis DSM 15480]
MKYLKRHKTYLCVTLICCIAYNLYFIFLVPGVKSGYLVYLDVLLLVGGLIFVCLDIARYYRWERKKADFLSAQSIADCELGNFENQDIVVHDQEIMAEQLREQFDANCNLEDYIAMWCHEVKIPLASTLLMAERIEDPKLRKSMQVQLEKMNQQLRQALLGCKVQSSVFDLQIKPVKLMDCVRTSLQNNQFFLLQSRFEMDIQVQGETVYTDPSWLVYVLDQLISNAVKYAKASPVLKIRANQTEERVRLFVEDNGEGIAQQDIRRIFEKGFTGSNHHNGRYKSTGMGLYMASVILQKLGVGIVVESELGEYTRFTLEFRDNHEHFLI